MENIKKAPTIPDKTPRISKKAGLPPESLIYVGKERSGKARIELIDYDETNFQEKEIQNIEECFPFKETSTITWINVSGVHQAEIIEGLGKHFDLHPLILEDILNTTKRPTMEDFERYLFLVLKLISYKEKGSDIISEQISLVLGHNFVISFQENGSHIFDSIKNRIRENKGRIRKMGADYLFYSLIDAIVDSYFVILERMGEMIEVLEDELVKNPNQKTLHSIHRLKRELILLRKAVWPLRDIITNLLRGDYKIIKKATIIYLRDVYEHTVQVIDSIETYRDMVSGMLDIYLSSVSNRLNEIMKVLTIISTIFIPLTFIVGLYGMNFKYMPELDSPWGYPAVWLVMLLIAFIMIVYFKKRRWI